jgi:hypothetical protein
LCNSESGFTWFRLFQPEHQNQCHHIKDVHPGKLHLSTVGAWAASACLILLQPLNEHFDQTVVYSFPILYQLSLLQSVEE